MTPADCELAVAVRQDIDEPTAELTFRLLDGDEERVGPMRPAGMNYGPRSLTFSGPSVGTRHAASYNPTMPNAEDTSTDALRVAVGKRVQDLREAKRIEPKDFAKAAGLTLSYLWRLEGGQQNVTLATIARVALALGEPMTALLDGIEPDPAIVQTKRPYRRKAD